MSRQRILAIVAKDFAELVRNPGTLLPAAGMVLGAIVPAFLTALIIPSLTGERLAESDDFRGAAEVAMAISPALAGLQGEALVQAFLFQQFQLLLLMVPVVGSMSIAAHAIIGEKQARTLEPLLATPLRTTELLAAKTLTPLLVAMTLMLAAAGLYVSGIITFAAPGVWRAVIDVRGAWMFGVVGPLVALVALQLAVIISSRVNDPRSAQQLGALVVLPITVAFVAQLMGQFLLGPGALALSAAGLTLINLVLMAVGVKVFDRERILMRWK